MRTSPLTHLSDAGYYWLCRSEGFRVDSPAGRFGLVEAVMFRMRPDWPDALIVRTGVLARRLVIVPIEDVKNVIPRRQRIVLEQEPVPSALDFVSELRARLRRLATESTTPGLRPTLERG